MWAATLALALPPAGTMAGAALPRLGAAPNFALTTQQNDRLWLTHLRGRVVVLTFMCTTCDACPALLPSLWDLTRTLGDAARRRVFFVAITVDPRRDTAGVLRGFARTHHVDLTSWALLTGTPPEIEVVARWYGAEIQRRDGVISHRCVVTLIDGAGTIRGRYAADEIGQLPADLRTLLTESAGS